jgi:ribonuclease P protein component
LTGIGAYEPLFAGGRRHDGVHLQLLSLPARTQFGRAGFAVPKRILPLAVDRNRVRRILREAVRAARPQVGAFDIVLRLKRRCPSANLRDLRDEANGLLATLCNGAHST